MFLKKNIFKTFELFPENEKPILEHYKDFYDSVFIALPPFIKINQKDFPFYGDELWEYPDDKTVHLYGERILWKDILNKSKLTNNNEIIKAIHSEHYFYREQFRRPDLNQELNNICNQFKYWYPADDFFGAFSKLDIYHSFKRLKINKIVIVNYHDRIEREIELKKYSSNAFCDVVTVFDRYIYSKDRAILFSTYWESNYYLICSAKRNLEIITEDSEIEGFFCDEKTNISWE